MFALFSPVPFGNVNTAAADTGSDIPVTLTKTTYGEHNPFAFRLTIEYELPQGTTTAYLTCMGKTVPLPVDADKVDLDGDYHDAYAFGEKPDGVDSVDWLTPFVNARGGEVSCKITAFSGEGEDAMELGASEFSVQLRDDERIEMKRVSVTGSGCEIWVHGDVDEDVVDAVASAYEEVPEGFAAYTKTIHVYSPDEWKREFSYDNEDFAVGYAYGKYVCLKDQGDVGKVTRNLLHEMIHDADLACRWSESEEMAAIYESEKNGYGNEEFHWENGGSGNYMTYNIHEFIAVGSTKFFRGDATLPEKCPRLYEWCIDTYGDDHAVGEDETVADSMDGLNGLAAIVDNDGEEIPIWMILGVGVLLGMICVAPVAGITLWFERRKRKRHR